MADELGHAVFVEFYATWCGPCKIEMPLVRAWHRNHPDATIVPIDVGERRSIVAEYARQYSLGNVALDPTSSSRALFNLQGFPTIVVIDATGHIRATWEGLNPAIGLALTNALSLPASP